MGSQSKWKPRRPKVVCDVQPPQKSVYGSLPQRVNLSFKKQRSFPYLEILKAAVVLSIVAFLIVGKTVAPTTPALAADAASEAKRTELEAQLKDLESQISAYQDQVSAYQKQGSSLKGEIGKLNAQIAALTLEMKANQYAIQQLDFQMSDNQAKLDQTKRDMVTATDNLALILRQIYQTDQTNVVLILLRSQKLSDFFNDVNNLSSLQDGLRTSINQITDLKANLEDEQQVLALNKADKEQLQAYRLQQKADTDQTKAQKNQLLTVTKGQESKYQDLLQKTKATAADIRSRIFQLLGGGEMSFGDAYKIAKLAGNASGLSPAFLLAILDRESALGQNVGKCTYQAAMNPKDQPLFLTLLSALNISPASVSVSCPNKDGAYGGAMGPAQFIPSTWNLYTAQISRVTGNSPANPWNNADAFTATALYLKDATASCSATYSSEANLERCAAARYYAGGRWKNYLWTYGQAVVARAQSFADDIATLNQ